MTPLLEEAHKSLERVQNFDTSLLPREQELGRALEFSEAVQPANKVIDLYRQIPLYALQDLPDQQLQVIKKQSDSFYTHLKQILDFAPGQNDPAAMRRTFIENLKNLYGNQFQSLSPIVAYTSSRLRDFSHIEDEARAALQRVQDRATELTQQLEERQAEAQKILDQTRQIAAEQGVSQQAIYFKEEAEAHEKLADTWRKYTIRPAIGLGIYAAATAFLGKIPYLAPASVYDLVQVSLSKVLLFGVITYMLILCARNFLSHKHNAVINRHRQNALLTFNALVNAATGEDRRDIVLTQAATCIFSPQDTGYGRAASTDSATPKFIEILPKLTGSATSGSH